ncbi:MAG: hypothetical protein HZA84_03660 [Thaumarchaeota archaeon]|nr:hypothetical protein [Nitrososphaerota archaeon]
MKYLVISAALFVLLFSGNNSTEAYTVDATMRHDFIKPWHQMLIDNDPIIINLTVKNNLNITKNYVIDVKLESVTNPQLVNHIIVPYTLSPFEEHTFPYRTNLIPGQWTVSLDLHVNSTDCCFVHGYQTFIVVQTLQVYHNFLATIGTILGTILSFSIAIIAIVFQQRNNKRNLVELREERKQTLEEMGKQREISSRALELTHKEFEGTIRPLIGAESGLIEFGKDQLAFYYMNYGKLPPASHKIRGLQSNEEITRDELKSAPNNAWPYIGTIMPNQKKAYIVALGAGELEQIKQGKVIFWIGFLLEYKYSDNKRGEYGVIYEFFNETQKFTIRDEWIV